LAEIGYVEGRNVIVEYSWAENHDDRLSPLAADLVRRRVAVIVALGTTSALAAKAATQTIPIVFRVGVDPVEIGLVASFNRPEGNLTGIANLSAPMISKRLALLHELLPAATIAALVNPANPSYARIETRELQAAASVLGVRMLVLNGGTASEIAGAFATLVEQQVGSLGYQMHQVGIYTGRILKGEKPADLPVEQAARIELTLNLKTVKALGIEFPTGLLVRGDEVIE
jgi:putative ABC transport system substrate-binding protein